MAVIICDISAWQYWRTPPVIRDAEIDPDTATEHNLFDLPASTLRTRANMREAERLIHTRLLTDLKGLSLPVHVMIETKGNVRNSALVHPSKRATGITEDLLKKLGNGLFILTPAATMLLHDQARSIVATAKMMFEACGIFSILPSNERVSFVVDELRSQGLLTQDGYPSGGIYGYSDEQGRPLHHPTDGLSQGWFPSFGNKGELTDLWKRPPLISTEELSVTSSNLRGLRGLTVARRALPYVFDGAASPEEARAVLLLCSGTHRGGEAFGKPDLNRKIILSSQAKTLAHRAYCFGDCVWADRKAILEVQGEAFHSDTHGFRQVTGRRSGLENMNYAVAELTHEQMADLELFDAVLPSLANKLGFDLQTRTVPFLKRRDRLHSELFSDPYDPD